MGGLSLTHGVRGLMASRGDEGMASSEGSSPFAWLHWRDGAGKTRSWERGGLSISLYLVFSRNLSR